jgi:hypothetical protein
MFAALNPADRVRPVPRERRNRADNPERDVSERGECRRDHQRRAAAQRRIVATRRDRECGQQAAEHDHQNGIEQHGESAQMPDRRHPGNERLPLSDLAEHRRTPHRVHRRFPGRRAERRQQRGKRRGGADRGDSRRTIAATSRINVLTRDDHNVNAETGDADHETTLQVRPQREHRHEKPERRAAAIVVSREQPDSHAQHRVGEKLRPKLHLRREADREQNHHAELDIERGARLGRGGGGERYRDHGAAEPENFEADHAEIAQTSTRRELPRAIRGSPTAGGELNTNKDRRGARRRAQSCRRRI